MRFATSYFGNRILRHAAADMRRLRDEGFGIVVHTFSENDLRFYAGTMAEIVGATREAGLEVWIDPWGVGGVFGGEAFSAAALEHPDWRQRDADGGPLPACCPNHPGFRGFLGEWIEAACATGADAVFWDEPHLHAAVDGRSGCHGACCRERAREGGGALDGFLVWAAGRVVARGGRNVVCLLPQDDPGHVSVEAATGAPGLAGLGCTPFWALAGVQPEDHVRRIGSGIVAAARRAGTASHVWIQGFAIPAGREEEITRAALAAGALGADAIAIWGFDACAGMSALACARPQRAWQAFRDAMARLTKEGTG